MHMHKYTLYIAWTGKFIAFPAHVNDWNVTDIASLKDPQTIARVKEFAGERKPVFYSSDIQNAHHIHFRGDGQHRLLQHHYGKLI